MDLLSGIAGTSPVRSAVNAGFYVYSRSRMSWLDRLDPVTVQQRTLRRLLQTAVSTRFGRDHDFASIQTVADYQNRVPLADL